MVALNQENSSAFRESHTFTAVEDLAPKSLPLVSTTRALQAYAIYRQPSHMV